MNRARPFVVCCIALALVLGGLPGVAASQGNQPGAGGLMPCHAADDGPAVHDTDCALGCDSAPMPATPATEWGPARVRDADAERPATLAPAPAFPELQPDHRQELSLPVTRAPPPARAATPVARHDVLRD